MKKLFVSILTTFLLLLSPVFAVEIEPPTALEVTGVVVSHTDNVQSAAIVNDRIWWEGETIRLRTEDKGWITLTMIRVEMIEGKGGVCTFQVEDSLVVVEGEDTDDKPTFSVRIQQSADYGLSR